MKKKGLILLHYTPKQRNIHNFFVIIIIILKFNTNIFTKLHVYINTKIKRYAKKNFYLLNLFKIYNNFD
jgi:hypothetical protein